MVVKTVGGYEKIFDRYQEGARFKFRPRGTRTLMVATAVSR